MVALPGAMPETKPDNADTVATDVREDAQAPPEIDPDNVLVVPIHNPVAPETTGTGLTVIALAA